MAINHNFEISCKVDNQTLQGIILFETKEQYQIPVSGFVPVLLKNYAEDLFLYLDFDGISSKPRFYLIFQDNLELLWLYPKENINFSIYLKHDDFLYKFYKMAIDFYKTYNNEEMFQEDLEELYIALENLREHYNIILDQLT
jgi:hypothetical protein